MSKSLGILAAALLVQASCGSPVGNDWLVRTNTDTITVREAGESWAALEPEGRAVFLGAGDPVPSFLQALGRRSILKRELDASGIAVSLKVRVFERARARSSMFLALSDSLPATLARGYGDEDILFFREHMGSTVWFTDVSTGVSSGPVHLPELPANLAAALSEAVPGERVSCGAETLILDSILVADSTLLAETLADSVRVGRLAVSRLSSAEASRIMRETERRAMADMTVDTSLVLLMAGGGTPAPEGTVLRSPLLTLGPEELEWEIAFSSLSTPVSPSSPTWLLYFIGNLVRLEAGAALFRERWPEEAEDIMAEAVEYAESAALDELYERNVLSSLIVSDSMVEAEFDSLDEPPLLPRRRVLEMGQVPPGMIEDVRSALAAEDYGELRRLLRPYSTFEGFDTGSLVSMPVTAEMVPDAMGNIVFSADPMDTVTWYGPMETRLGTMMLYRTVRELPGERAALEDVRELLEARVRSRLEADGLQAWIDALEREAGLEMNLELIRRLPGDPGLWSDL